MQVRLEVVVLILEEPVVPKPIQDKLEDPKPLIQMEEMGVRITYSILLNYLVIISFAGDKSWKGLGTVSILNGLVY